MVKLIFFGDWNKNGCGSRYGHHDYDSGDKKTKILIDKKLLKRQKTKYNKDKKTEGSNSGSGLWQNI